MLDKYFSERVGEVVQGCKMTVMHYNSGALMKMPDGTTAFVHVSMKQMLSMMHYTLVM